MADRLPTWGTRHQDLHELLQSPHGRRVMLDIWMRKSEVDPSTPKPTGYEQIAVLNWEIDIGRMLLDWPDLDRDAISRRVKDLLRLKTN